MTTLSYTTLWDTTCEETRCSTGTDLRRTCGRQTSRALAHSRSGWRGASHSMPMPNRPVRGSSMARSIPKAPASQTSVGSQPKALSSSVTATSRPSRPPTWPVNPEVNTSPTARHRPTRPTGGTRASAIRKSSSGLNGLRDHRLEDAAAGRQPQLNRWPPFPLQCRVNGADTDRMPRGGACWRRRPHSAALLAPPLRRGSDLREAATSAPTLTEQRSAGPPGPPRHPTAPGHQGSMRGEGAHKGEGRHKPSTASQPAG